MARNDAAHRAHNAALRPGDVWAEKDRWLPVVLQVQRQMNCKNVGRLAGLPAGTLVLNHYMLVSGLVKWFVRYEIGKQWVLIGGFVTEYLPDDYDDRRRQPAKPLTTHGKFVVINGKKGGNDLERVCRVLIDGDGLPVPVDPQIWAAMGLEG
jgi:hypothetical protein